jgi:hypothetical protein
VETGTRSQHIKNSSTFSNPPPADALCFVVVQGVVGSPHPSSRAGVHAWPVGADFQWR